jgi:hypothetical protein
LKAIQLTVDQWQRIRNELHAEYPKTAFMIRDKMKKVLGFTIREHSYWNAELVSKTFEIHLDFYSENKRTMFLLKFSDIIGAPSDKL